MDGRARNHVDLVASDRRLAFARQKEENLLGLLVAMDGYRRTRIEGLDERTEVRLP
jgi:hypothetical protein